MKKVTKLIRIEACFDTPTRRDQRVEVLISSDAPVIDTLTAVKKRLVELKINATNVRITKFIGSLPSQVGGRWAARRSAS